MWRRVQGWVGVAVTLRTKREAEEVEICIVAIRKCKRYTPIDCAIVFTVVSENHENCSVIFHDFEQIIQLHSLFLYVSLYYINTGNS